MKAVVFAAGEGRRLRPLTVNRPKPMLPVANRPILEYIVEALDGAGVDDLVLVVGSNRERVQNYFGDDSRWNLDVSFAIQDHQLGTGHALLAAKAQIDGPFIALNGDRIIDADLIERVWTRHRETGDPAMGVTQVGTPSRYGVVEVDGREVVGIEERPPPEFVRSDFINAGVYAFTPGIFGAIERTAGRGERTVPDALSTLLDDSCIQAVRHRGVWLDISEPWDLLTVNETLLVSRSPRSGETSTIDGSAVVDDETALGVDVAVHPQAAVLSGVALGDNVRVGAGVIVENAVVLPDVTLNRGAIVTDCIVGANTTIGARTTIDGVTTDVVIDDTVYHDVSLGGVVGDNATVGADVTVDPGTIIGNDVTIDRGAAVSGRVDHGSHVVRG